MHGISNRGIRFYPPHNNSSDEAAEVRRSWRITDGVRSGWRTLRVSVLSATTSTPAYWNGPAKDSVRLAQPPLHRCRMFPLLLVQMGYGLL